MPTPTSTDLTDTMDVDMDIDLGAEPDLEVEPEPMNFESSAVLESQPEEDPSAETSNAEIAPDKVHIRGLDNLTTSDIRAFTQEHLPNANLVKVEWIDDTSANLVYDGPDSASQALSVFSADLNSSSPLQLRDAKSLSLQPHVQLQVRIALITDVKQRGARDASRFYLLNPELDPANRRSNNDKRRGHDGRRPRRQRDEEEDVPFDVNMYDDDAAALATRPSRLPRDILYDSAESGDVRDVRRPPRTNRGNGDLFSNHISNRSGSGRLRDRSASPLREGDGRQGFDENDPRPRARRRSHTPPPYRRRTDNTAIIDNDLLRKNNAKRELFPSDNAQKELFGPTPKTGILQNAAESSNTSKELFPAKQTSFNNNNSSSSIELFPRRKGSTGGHRRKDAFDAADSTSTSPARTSTPESRAKSRNLADRITNGPSILRGNENDSEQSSGFSIRGTAQTQDNPGFSIRGAAGVNQRVKELFPDKIEGDTGRDLFSRISGRTASRAKAADMYT